MEDLLVNLAQRRLYFCRHGQLVKSYPVAIGKPQTPTPTGKYTITRKIINPGGILGTRWLELSIPNGPYGIHGTPHPWTIGTAASNGCIRMYNKDIEELFPLVKIGTPVTIITGKERPVDSTSSAYFNYTVRPGDSLWKIARKFNLRVEELRAANSLTHDLIYPGQILRIPRTDKSRHVAQL
ncbi:L,D-transpeptidase family protein [Calderihabitans maritimus]|uniref:Uncharacterized protein n=1 Tax=Calderihabitans maritimus TaxID=1246530 RepID=A0A1Z5HQ44_9FIRM|nr:L,D-transpeptidase family protein [Calderihabitans maritimus]GAW91649.1 hypothetical protein PTH_0095 [Calderihabitans maritimus]